MQSPPGSDSTRHPQGGHTTHTIGTTTSGVSTSLHFTASDSITKREKNRTASQRSRQRRKDWIDSIYLRIDELNGLIQARSTELDHIRQDIFMLNSVLVLSQRETTLSGDPSGHEVSMSPRIHRIHEASVSPRSHLRHDESIPSLCPPRHEASVSPRSHHRYEGYPFPVLLSQEDTSDPEEGSDLEFEESTSRRREGDPPTM